MNFDKQAFMEEVEKKEGREYTMYMLENVPHIGIGHNIISRALADETLDFLGIEDESELMTATLNDAQCEFLLEKDVDIAINDAISLIGQEAFDAMDATRQHVVVDMSFNLGRPRFKLFEKMLDAVKTGDYNEASAQILDSKAARNPLTSKRYHELSEQMRVGVAETPESPETFGMTLEKGPELATKEQMDVRLDRIIVSGVAR